ncbi:MAG: alpha/beta fold hydrolase, partial [Firmicutes bacterium]|nr:alpha/beta fold hydrolase [Bacillota bacterium]
MENFRNHYIERGQGQPLILLHGNGEDSSYFEHQLREFSRDYRVIAVDTRGHGKSPRGTVPFRIRQFAEDLHSFMQQQGIEKAHLLGFSDGGNIALTFALKYPHMVEKLILNGANLYPEGVKDGVQLPIELEYRIALMCAEHSAKAAAEAEMLGLMVNDPHIDPKELAALAVPTL